MKSMRALLGLFVLAACTTGTPPVGGGAESTVSPRHGMQTGAGVVSV